MGQLSVFAFSIACLCCQAQADNLKLIVTSSRLKVAASDHTGVYDGDDAIYLIGGISRSFGTLQQITKYSISIGVVVELGRYRGVTASAALMSDGSIIHIGGKSPSGNRFFEIDRISTNRTFPWTRVNVLPQPASGFHGTWDQSRGVVYMFGGVNDESPYMAAVWMYNATHNILSQVGQLPEARAYAGTAWDPEREMAYIFGGGPESSAQDILTFTPASGQVIKLSTRLPYPMEFPRAVYVEYTGQVFILDKSGVFSFDPDSHVVQQVMVDGLPSSLDRPAVVYADKLARIYIFGGVEQVPGQAPKDRDEIAYISFRADDMSSTTEPCNETTLDPSTKPTTTSEEATDPASSENPVCPDGSDYCHAGAYRLALWDILTIVAGGVLMAALAASTWFVWRKHKLRASKPNERVPVRLKTILNQFRIGDWPKSNEIPYDKSTGTKNSSITTVLTSAYDISRYEIPHDCLCIDKSVVLGSGQFGMVFKGTLTLASKQEPYEQVVAVKMLKVNNYESVTSFLKELKLMIHVGAHDNVVRLLGACTVEVQNLSLVIEYCEHGSLRKYIAVNREELDQVDVDDLLRWTLQIASGMEYLAARKVIHGDLALRNVLLDGARTAKVSDFGLGARLYEYALYVKNTEQKLLPWRWMAPETLTELRFSYASDVWAFGVTTWELYSLGRVPYPGIGWAAGFVEQLLDGYRNSRPQYANEEVYSVLMSCWAKETRDRPSMTQIKERLMLLVE